MPLRIEKAVYGGDGLARDPSGRVALIPFTLPGELAEELPGKPASPFPHVLQPSSDRIEARCMHFGLCGGCQYQMAQYSAQVDLKRSILLETLGRAVARDLPEPEVQASPEPWGYRNRIRLRVKEHDGALQLGYNLRGSDHFLPIRMCPIAAPVLWRAAETLLSSAAHPRIGSWLRRAQEVEFSCNETESKVQVHLLCSKKTRHTELLEPLAAALQDAQIPVASVHASELHAASGRPGAELATWGARGFVYEVGPDKYWLERGTFFQVNRFLVPAMVGLVCGDRSGLLAWDLYAGVGLFSRQLARRFQSVTAVEANSLAIPELKRGLPRPSDQVVHATTLDFVRRAVLQRERPELIVLDPPRAGAGEEICNILLRLQPRSIVYVSCDPTTLSRDLRTLSAGPYQMTELHLVDLFPQTYHLETVMVLQRRDMAS